MTADVSRRFQAAAIETVARAGGLDRVLSHLCSQVEQVICDSICLSTVRDAFSGETNVVAASGAPDKLIDALNGPSPADFEDACGIVGGWSVPILSSEETLIGSLTVYRSKEDEPTAAEEQILATAGNIARIAIEQHRIAQTLRAFEERQVESAAQDARSLDNLSVMAGSIAHEYNNLLAVIVGNADLAIASGNLQPPVADWIADIQKAGKRASELTRQLQELGGKEISCVETVDLPDLVAKVAEHLRTLTSDVIEYEHLNDDESLYVSGDVSRIQEIVMSLVGSAPQAIDTSADTIYIRTGVFTADRAYLQQSYAGDELPEGDYVFVEVQRSGFGLTDDDLRRNRDPFFVPKPAGRAMGLASAFGIIKRHGGALHLDNNPVTGSTFRALLPRRILATAPAASDVVRDEEDSSTGIVLVVDDEPMVVSVAKEMLSGRGLRVLTAYDGEHGVSIARQHIKEIDVVVLDATMADLSAEDTFRALRALRGDLPVIFCSGQPEAYCLNLVEGRELTGFVSKPFQSSDLYDAVQDLMDLRERAPSAPNSDHESEDLAPDKPM